MAWYDHNNRNGGYSTYGRIEPGYGGNSYPDHVHRPVIADTEGRRHSIVGYKANHNYVASTEQAIELRVRAMSTDHKHSPTRKESYTGHGVGEKPVLVPWSSARDRPEKANEFSPKARNEVVHGQNKGSPRHNVYRDHSPPSRNHYYPTDDYGKHNHPNNSDDDDDDDDDDVICNDGVCFKNNKKEAKPNYLKEQDYDKLKGNGYSPPSYTSTQPRKDTYFQSPYPEKNEKHRENGYAPHSYTPPASTQPRKENYSETTYPEDTERNKGNGYSPPYNVPAPTQPRKEKYYESTYPENTEKNKGNGYVPPYNGPASTQPSKETFYDTSNNRPIMYSSLPKVKTRSDTDRGTANESTKNSPVSMAPPQQHFDPSPRKDKGNKETIDSVEARRRYARTSPQAGALAEEKFTGIIDSKEAARKYKGVFVSDSKMAPGSRAGY